MMKKLFINPVAVIFPHILWFINGAYTAAIGDIIVEVLDTPTKCSLFADYGDTMLVIYNTTSSEFISLENGPSEITVGDGGLLRGWNEGLLGACEGQRRRITVKSELVMYTIRALKITKPVPDNPPLPWILHAHNLTTVIMVTELEDINKYSETNTEDDTYTETDEQEGKDSGQSTREEESSMFDEFIDLLIQLQFVAIPVAVILFLVVLYHLYRLKSPYKRTRFYKVSDHDHPPENGIAVQSF